MGNNKSFFLRLDQFPVSINRAWRTVRGRWILSDDYRKFKKYVQARLIDARITKMPWVTCSVDLWLFPNNFRKFDIDNRFKTLFDALTECGFWTDDSVVSSVSCYRCPVTTNDNPVSYVVFRCGHIFQTTIPDEMYVEVKDFVYKERNKNGTKCKTRHPK